MIIGGVEIEKKLRNILLFVLFGFLVISQSAQIISHINIGKVDEPTVSSASYMSDVSVAHITAPTTLPNNNYNEADSALPPIKRHVFRVAPITYQFNLLSNKTESTGFVDVRKYQSNYLP